MKFPIHFVKIAVVLVLAYVIPIAMYPYIVQSIIHLTGPLFVSDYPVVTYFGTIRFLVSITIASFYFGWWFKRLLILIKQEWNGRP